VKPRFSLLDNKPSKVINAGVIGATSLRVEAKMIPSGVKSACITLWPIERGSDEIIIQDADTEVNANMHGGSPWCSVGAAVAMEMNEIHGERVSARPEHLQRATKAKLLDSDRKVTARTLKTRTNNTCE
jgi:hypothetical protein